MSRGPGRVEQRLSEYLLSAADTDHPSRTTPELVWYVYECRWDDPERFPKPWQYRSVQRALQRMRHRGKDGQVVYRPEDHTYALHPSLVAVIRALADASSGREVAVRPAPA